MYRFLAFIIMTIFILLIGAGVVLLNKIECNAKAKAIGYECQYDIWAGCILIKPDGKKVLLEQLRDYFN